MRLNRIVIARTLQPFILLFQEKNETIARKSSIDKFWRTQGLSPNLKYEGCMRNSTV